MYFGHIYLSKKKIITTIIPAIIIISAVIIGIYLIQTKQILKSRANIDLIQAFEIKDSQDQVINCVPGENNASTTCTTDSSEVKIRVKDLNALIE